MHIIIFLLIHRCLFDSDYQNTHRSEIHNCKSCIVTGITFLMEGGRQIPFGRAHVQMCRKQISEDGHVDSYLQLGISIVGRIHEILISVSPFLRQKG